MKENRETGEEEKDKRGKGEINEKSENKEKKKEWVWNREKPGEKGRKMREKKNN